MLRLVVLFGVVVVGSVSRAEAQVVPGAETALRDSVAGELCEANDPMPVAPIVPERAQPIDPPATLAVPIPNLCAVDPGVVRIQGLARTRGVPLYVLDGRRLTAVEISRLDKTKLESISILRPEAAVSQFGPDGRDGAVIIISRLPEVISTPTP